jgi:hypothetical protein
MDDTAIELANNPLWNLTWNDPNCINISCRAYFIGWSLDQERYPTSEFPKYSLYPVYYYCATVIFFSAIYLIRILRDGHAGSRARENVMAWWRMFFYRRFTGKLGEAADLSYGQLTLLAMTTIFICPLPFYQGYFFRLLFRYGSPPLSVRCAFIISALLPVNLALAGKVNLISMLTGISYAKLNLWHRYVSFLMYYFAVIHLVPHFLAPIREGGDIELQELLIDKRREVS